MPSAEFIKVRIGQTAMRARRAGEREIVVEDLLALSPGDVIAVEGADMIVERSEANRSAPGPHGPVPETRIHFRPVGVEAGSTPS